MKTLLILISLVGLFSCNKEFQVTQVAPSTILPNEPTIIDFGNPYGISPKMVYSGWLGIEEFKGGHCLCYIDSSKVVQYIIKGDFPVQPSARFNLDSIGALIKDKK